MKTMHGSVAVSGSTPVVVLQQAAESFAALDFANLQSDCGSRLDQLVIEPLMIPLRDGRRSAKIESDFAF